MRVATLPTKYGERMTLRLLALQTTALTLERLGMSPHDLGCFEELINKPHGMILLTGPTGSGKSTTLYAALRRLIAQEQWNIVTIEDPIEYAIAGVAQVEVDSADKVSFGKALRSVLRHDPDIVMIARSAIARRPTSQSKHRLRSPRVEHVAHELGGECDHAAHRHGRRSVSDRGHRAAGRRSTVGARLCQHCRKERALTPAEAIALGRPESAGHTVYEPGGCLYCANRGYVGRLGLFELLPVNETLARSVAEGADEAELMRHARAANIPQLTDDALQKLFAGLTTVREALSAVTVW